ncbi:MAG TPA: DUF2027 domain-containing protein [Prolixibacteraceae bacterium]|nr:DUF2027 domain-containing protein [Prolixibacteraceae bacterium]
MLKIGDRVRFLNAVGGGKITGFVSPKVVTVEDEQGFEVPVLITELVKDARFEEILERPRVIEKKSSKEKVEAPKPKKESLPLFASSAGNPATAEPAYFLAFVPEVPTLPLSGEIKAWLVNDSRNTLLFHFSLLKEGTYFSEKSGRLAPFSRIPLKGFGHEDLSTFPDFGLQLLPFEGKSIRLPGAVVKTLKVNPVRFYKETSFSENPYFEKRAMLLDIKEKDMSADLEKLRHHDFSAPEVTAESGDRALQKPAKKEAPDIREVDLHIGELVDSAAGLSNKEMLDLQMERFRSEMEKAIRLGVRRIVFIHGVGQGTLKNELRRELSARYKKYDVQDASFREYGYGATMVILK